MVITTYPGANAQTMETLVTTPIENALQGIDNVDYISSTSASGTSRVVLNLTVNADVNSTITDIESALSGVKSSLPNAVNDPIIRQADSTSMPDMVLSYSSAQMPTSNISDYLTRTIEPTIANINGVGDIQIMGNRQYAMRVWLDVNKMRAYGITASDIKQALSTQNVQATPGDINRDNQIITINAQTDGHTVTSFQNLIIKTVNQKPIYLKDVADVKLGAQDTTSAMFTNNKPSVGLAITYKNDANPLTTAALIQNALTQIHLPKDLKVQVMRNSASYINASLKDVIETLIITIIAVLAIIILFLGSWRLSLIPLVTIPLSIAGAFIIMYFLGFSINVLTLLAFVLAIGLVVDDAIVVMENIHRHMQLGKTSKHAAIIGIKEITIAVIGITITLLAVFLPIGFNNSTTGALFKSFAFTLAGSVLISGIVALFFTPMMCAKLLTTKTHNKFEHKVTQLLQLLTEKYHRLLLAIINLKKLIVLVFTFILILGGTTFYLLSQNAQLAPAEDQGVIIGMAQAPTSASVNYTQKYTAQLNSITNLNQEIKNLSIVNGFPQGQASAMIIMKLKDWDQRSQSADEITAQLMPKVRQIAGLNIMLSSPPSLPISKGIYNFQFVIKSTGSYEALSKVVNQMTKQAQTNPDILNTQVDLHINQPQANVIINKEKANALGVSMDGIATILSIGFGQPQNNEFTRDGYAYYIIPQINDAQRSNENIINELTVKSASGDNIPLSTFVRIENTVTSSTWNHFQGQHSATISAQLANGFSTKAALTYFQNLANKYMKEDMNTDTSGQTRTFLQTQNSMSWLFICALIVIFLTLAAQYESLKDPLTIILTVPLAITSALIALFFINYSLNIYTEIGLITLIGLISKHGILLIDFAKQYQQKHQSTPQKAIIQAACVRFKPVLMTTAAMVLAHIDHA